MPETHARAPFTSQVVDPSEVPDAIVGAWQRLVLEQTEATAFLGPTFARAVAGLNDHARVCIILRDSAPVGFFPFQFHSQWKAVLAAAEPLGGAISDYAGLVATAETRLSPEILLDLAGVHSFTFSALPDSQGKFGLRGEESRPGLRIDVTTGGDAYWAQRRDDHVGLVRDTERRRRKLEKDLGPLRFEFQCADRMAGLEHLIRMKRSQYARTGAGDPLAQANNRRLLQALLDSKEIDCVGVLSALHAGDTWVASHFGLMCGSRLNYWFPVYNSELTKYSPGRQLLLATITDAKANGISIIDRGEGASAAKRDFATHEIQFFRGRWSRASARAFINKAEDSLRWRLERTAL